jgi:hypothetical protein
MAWRFKAGKISAERRWRALQKAETVGVAEVSGCSSSVAKKPLSSCSVLLLRRFSRKVTRWWKGRWRVRVKAFSERRKRSIQSGENSACLSWSYTERNARQRLCLFSVETDGVATFHRRAPVRAQ